MVVRVCAFIPHTHTNTCERARICYRLQTSHSVNKLMNFCLLLLWLLLILQTRLCSGWMDIECEDKIAKSSIRWFIWVITNLWTLWAETHSLGVLWMCQMKWNFWFVSAFEWVSEWETDRASVCVCVFSRVLLLWNYQHICIMA